WWPQFKEDSRVPGETGEEDQGGPTKSMNCLSNDFYVDPMTINRVVREDLGLTSYTRTMRHLLTEDMKRKRLTRCKKVLTWLKGNDSIVIVSDKKIFTKRYRGCTVQNIRQEYASLLFKAGEKIHKETYYKVLRYTVLPWLKAKYPEGNYVWTQDGVPSHTSDLCQKFCTVNMAHFWPKDMWPSSSPDLNLLDFAVRGELERKANRIPHPNVDALKATIRTKWDKLLEEFLINSCKAFRVHVEAVIEAEGGHIE
ncbi:Uncharacterized protein FKW44_004830, partial [Caligus rogercresseyi]